MSALDAPADARDQQIKELEAGLMKARAELETLQKKVPPDYDQLAKEARKRFLQFIVSRVNPGAEDRLKGDLSSWGPELWQEAGRLGLIGFNAPQALGGEGRDVAAWCITLEELGKLIEDPGFLVVLMVSKNLARLMYDLGRQDLVEKFGKPMIRGELLLSWAMWEQADPTFMQSVAKKVDGGWKITASKPIIIGALYANIFAVVVREEASSEPALFLVKRSDPNVKVSPVGTTGGRHVGFGSLELKDTFVPDEQLLLDNDVVGTASRVFASEGLVNAMAAHVGWMQRIFNLCVEGLRPKVRQGQQVLDFPHVQSELGRLHMGIETARSLMLRVMEKYRLKEHDPMSEPLTVIFRHYVVERAMDTARTVVTLQGAAGYMDANPYGRYFTHVAALLHIGGAHDLLPMMVGARQLMEMEMRKLRRVGL